MVLSGDGGFGKTGLGEALLMEVCPDGFWFVDDPDDFKELEGLLEEGQGILIDEITFAKVEPNQIKRLFDLEKSRRVKCRHFNGSKPKGCPIIFCSNSNESRFFPFIEDEYDKTGIFRRHLFQEVRADVRRLPGNARAVPSSAPGVLESGNGFEDNPFGHSLGFYEDGEN